MDTWAKMSSRSRNVIDLKKATPQRAKTREAPRSSAQRPQRLRTRRRNKRIVTSIACILASAGIVGALGAASHLQQLAIADVSVSGAQQLSSESLSSAVKDGLEKTGFRLFSRKNMFLYPKSTIESELSADFPRIKEVNVARESFLATALLVTVEERAPYAMWCNGTTCYALDSRGFIFAEKTDEPEKKYVFRGGLVSGEDTIGQTFLEGRLPGVIALLDALAAAGYVPASLTVESEKDFTVTLETGQELLASFDSSAEELVRNLTTTLESESLQGKFELLKYIDLRFGNRVYYQ